MAENHYTPYRKALEARRQRVRRLYEDGHSIRTVAEIVGRGYATVHRDLLLAGVVLRQRGGSTPSRNIKPTAPPVARCGGRENGRPVTGTYCLDKQDHPEHVVSGGR